MKKFIIKRTSLFSLANYLILSDDIEVARINLNYDGRFFDTHSGIININYPSQMTISFDADPTDLPQEKRKIGFFRNYKRKTNIDFYMGNQKIASFIQRPSGGKIRLDNTIFKIITNNNEYTVNYTISGNLLDKNGQIVAKVKQNLNSIGPIIIEVDELLADSTLPYVLVCIYTMLRVNIFSAVLFPIPFSRVRV